MEPSVLHVIEAVGAAALLAGVGLLLNQKSALVRIETLLTGANGDNGLVGDVKALRARSHTQGDEIHAVVGRVEVHTMRLDTMERRLGPDDRRSHAS